MAVFYPTERRDDQHHPLLAYDQLVSALTDGTWAASGRNGTRRDASGGNGTDNR
ncbi:hypothetical protein [Arthrobacter sp. H14]|uniref:hypothetical protein n=1 Tax=Arthrobacter sp. H14 TaxID=1312959 RepID=UPI001C1E8ACA|nr:hypothetical protein [Arthrobacter sp. H14]